MKKSRKIFAGLVLALSMHRNFSADGWDWLRLAAHTAETISDIHTITTSSNTHYLAREHEKECAADINEITFHRNRFEGMIDLMDYQYSYGFERLILNDAHTHGEYYREFHYVRRRVKAAIDELIRIRDRHWMEAYPFGHSLNNFIGDMRGLSRFIQNSTLYQRENRWHW